MADTAFASGFYAQLQTDNHGLYSPLTLLVANSFSARSAASAAGARNGHGESNRLRLSRSRCRKIAESPDRCSAALATLRPAPSRNRVWPSVDVLEIPRIEVWSLL